MKKTTFAEYLAHRSKGRLIIELDEKTPPKDGPNSAVAGEGGGAAAAAPPGANTGISSTVNLGKDNEFKPFVITDDPRNPAYPSNRNLAPIVRAFLESPKVKVYNSMDKEGAPKPHTLPQKKLYMVGGSVRDHLHGKTPHDIDLVTDATPDEIRMILSDNGFEETDANAAPEEPAMPPDPMAGPDDSADVEPSKPSKTKKGGSPRSSVHGSKIFYVKGRDKAGTDFVFGVKVNGQEFDLATFRKDSKGSDGRHPDQMSFAGHKDDSARRDLTINSLYLLVNNPDGPNAQVTDFHGGIHDLANNDVRFVGNAQDRLDEDLLRALRYVRFAARYGKGKVQEDIKNAIKKVAPNIRKVVSPERIQEEFSKGLAYEDVDPAIYVKLYKDMGLLDVVFPGMKVKLDAPEDYPQDRDKAVVIASLLRGNPPEAVSQCLQDGKWSGQDIKRVMFLLKMLEMHPHLAPDELDQYLRQYQSSGINPKGLESWWDSNKKGNKELLRSFVDFAGGPRVSPMNRGDDGKEGVHPQFADLLDASSGKPRPRAGVNPSAIGVRKREAEHGNWQKLYQSYQPRARRPPESGTPV